VTDVESTLERLRQDGLYRQLRSIASAPGPRVRLDDRDVLLLCSNDYLGLAGHPAVCAAAADAAERWGAGAGASRLVSGNMTVHDQLERELADFKGHEACVLFGSGFLANTGVIPALADRGDVILSDALNHASIIEGCRQSRAQTIVYDHCDVDAVAAGLKRAEGRQSLIVTDAVFSMDGDLAPLQDIVDLAQHHGARVVVDEAHATGVVGPGGRGLVAALGLEQAVDVVIGTLSKALGSYGAFACCAEPMAELLINRARTLIYSTALPPPSVAAANAALRIIQEQPALVERAAHNARVLRKELANFGFAVSPGDIPIIPLIIGDPHHATAMCHAALRDGVFAQAIRPPTVPQGTSRLRVVTMSEHSDDDLQYAASTLASAHAQTLVEAAATPSDSPVPR
jgi:8-amino-7-oxononanoate synthase